MNRGAAHETAARSDAPHPAAPPGRGPRSRATPRKWTRRARRGSGLPASLRTSARGRAAWPTGCCASSTHRAAAQSRRPLTVGLYPRRGEVHKHATSLSRGLCALVAVGLLTYKSRGVLVPRTHTLPPLSSKSIFESNLPSQRAPGRCARGGARPAPREPRAQTPDPRHQLQTHPSPGRRCTVRLHSCASPAGSQMPMTQRMN